MSKNDCGISRRQLIEAACSLAALSVVPMIKKKKSALAAPTEERGSAETAALTAAQEEYDKAKEQLESIGSELESTQYELSQTQSELDKLGSDIDDTQSGIDEKTEELDNAQKALAAYLEINYKSGRMSFLDLLLSSKDFNDLVTRTYYATKVQNAQVETINEIRQIKEDLVDRKATLTDQQEEQKKLEEQLQSQTDALQKSQDEANQVLSQLSSQVQELFQQQQAELTAAAEARTKAKNAAEAGAAIGANAPSVSQGSIVDDAYACLGIPYVWGGDDDNFGEVGGFDCSGFVQHCYALEGWEIGRTTWDQIAQIQAANNWRDSVDQLSPGDLLFPSDGHVGIYIGNNQMIDAPYPGMYIQVDDVDKFIGGGSPV